jgi:acyl carrier protein
LKDIIEISNEVKAGEDYENATSLISDGILTSFDIVTLVSLLNMKFDINISVMDLVPENFESASAILELVNKLKEN